MPDKCHGTVLPRFRPGDALIRELNRDVAAAEHLSRLRRVRIREARRRWIVKAGDTAPSTPMWVSPQSWLADLGSWTVTSAGQEALARNKMRSATLVRVAAVLASYADHRNGRHCAASNSTVATSAQCSPRTVTTARALLREAGLAVEIRRGTGSSAIPAHGRRPSVWHLVSRVVPVDNRRRCDLPPSLCDRRLSHLKKESPSDRSRSTRRIPDRSNRRRRSAPRPLHVQRLAAGVIAGSVGLGAVHPGQICDALTRSQLDLSAWTARQLLESLNSDMRARGWCWPDAIHQPGAFLASRLKRLPTIPPTLAPAPSRKSEIQVSDGPPPASAAARAAAKAYFAANRRPCLAQQLGVRPSRSAPEAQGGEVAAEHVCTDQRSVYAVRAGAGVESQDWGRGAQLIAGQG